MKFLALVFLAVAVVNAGPLFQQDSKEVGFVQQLQQHEVYVQDQVRQERQLRQERQERQERQKDRKTERQKDK
jgi:hypothetical protein